MVYVLFFVSFFVVFTGIRQKISEWKEYKAKRRKLHWIKKKKKLWNLKMSQFTPVMLSVSARFCLGFLSNGTSLEMFNSGGTKLTVMLHLEGVNSSEDLNINKIEKWSVIILIKRTKKIKFKNFFYFF